MKNNPRILVAYDGSYLADKAVREAIELAQRFRGSITVLIVHWSEPEAVVSELSHRAERRITETFVEHRVIVETSLNPPRRILWHAENGGYDLIVMGGRGASSNRPWVSGSVSSRVVGDSSCPVLIIK